MYELEINNVRVPLIKGQKIAITKQVNNLGELKDRQTTFTNKFKIPKTAAVMKLFNGLGLVGNISRVPYEISNCKLIINNIEILSSGNAYITSADKKNFDVTVYDGNIYFFQQIGNKKLNDLDYTDLNHQLTPVNYINSFANTDGYIYAVSDNGKISTDFDTNKIEINYQLGSIYIKTLWNKIFNSTEYDYEFIDFDSRKFDKLVLTPRRGYNAEVDAVNEPFDLDYTINDNITRDTSYYGRSLGSDFVWHGLIFGFILNNQVEKYKYYTEWNLTQQQNNNVLNNGAVTVTENGQYNLDIDMTVSLLPDLHTLTVQFIIVKNGIETILYNNVLNYSTSVPDSVNVVLNENYDALAGDVFEFKFITFGDWNEESILPLNAFPPIITGTTNYSGTFNFFSSSTTVIDLKYTNFIGDIEQKALFKSIMQHFGFVMQPKRNTKTYQFKRIQDILTDTDNAIDWSSKYVECTKENYQLSGYSQLNRMGYIYYDSNSDKFADGFLSVDNKNLTTEKTLFTSPFNACDVNTDITLNNNLITSTPFWAANRDSDGTITSYKPTNNKNYIAEVRNITETIKYGLTEGSAITYNGVVPRLDFSNLRYNTIINENYERLNVVLDSNVVRNIKVRLTAKDVVDFDFFKLVFIEQLGSYFYVNKIKYKGDAVTDVEVVQVKKEAYVCDLIANAGSYGLVAKENVTVQLDGTSSQGNVIDSWLWEVVSEPTGSNASIINSDEMVATLDCSVAGEYIIRLTISNDNCQSVSEVIIIKSA